MSTQKRLFFGPIAGIVVVMVLAGMLYAPTALALADKGNNNNNGNKGLDNALNHANTNGINNGITNALNHQDDDHGKGKDKNPKCNIHKYDGTCDFKKPKLKITFPHQNGKAIGPSVTITGTASDSGVGLDSVKVSVDLNAFTVVSTTNGPWSDTVNLSPGVHIVVAEATDKAHNITFDHVVFNVS
jgi:glucodextranase-like protein